MSDAGDAHQVGSLGDEAAKLLGALSGWAREHAGEASEGLSGFASHAATSAQELSEHLATGAPECTLCPVCRTAHAIRQLSPEVTAHLAAAAASLARAATAHMRPPDPGHGDRIEHIDLD